MISKFSQILYRDADIQNTNNILAALHQTGPHNRLLDVGCWDGMTTLNWAKAAASQEVFGIEPVASSARLAAKKNIKISQVKADAQKWPYKNNFFDCIVTNQVVEHLTDLDHFFGECSRVLKPGGYVITSTNNLSSLHNIFALTLGWAPFDLTNSSRAAMGIGNPLAFHRHKIDARGNTWSHKCIYTTKWLAEWQQLYGLNMVNTYGAGFYPLPAYLGNYFKTYSAFIALVCQKQK